MKKFYYVGKPLASKSLLNRAYLVQDYAPALQVVGESQAQDVLLLKQGLTDLHRGRPVDCGLAGTVLRFLAVRAARIPGEHVLTGKNRLFTRPQTELLSLIGQLGAEAKILDNKLLIRGRQFRPLGDMITVRTDRSSQFASALVLNAWDLDFPLFISLSKNTVSPGYLAMTLKLVEQLGMKVDNYAIEIRIPPKQKVLANKFEAEIDMSSAFTIAAMATVGGEARILNFPAVSLQPDVAFVEVLRAMGVHVQFEGQCLVVRKAGILKGVNQNLLHNPDLFPVLAALAATASGESHLFGAPHLEYKESHRIARMAQLIGMCNRRVEVMPDGLKVFGKPIEPSEISQKPIKFDPDSDHRLAMAAAVLKTAGFPIDIASPEVVDKSFPGFWSLVPEAAQ